MEVSGKITNAYSVVPGTFENSGKRTISGIFREHPKLRGPPLYCTRAWCRENWKRRGNSLVACDSLVQRSKVIGKIGPFADLHPQAQPVAIQEIVVSLQL